MTRTQFCVVSGSLVVFCLTLAGGPTASAPTASAPIVAGQAWCTRGGDKPAEIAGLHNVFWPLDALVSGSAPASEADFAAIRAIGVRSIISVDGAAPDVAAARRAGLRYVHIPLQYGGVDDVQRRMLAQAMRDLPRPIYVHCHHGKHRGPAAAAVAAVAVGWWTPDQAVAFLTHAGTSSSYPGLYTAARTGPCLSKDELARLDEELTEVAPTGDLATAMVAIDVAAEHLDEIRKAGWRTPPDHPDLVPSAEAGRITELLRGHRATSQPVGEEDRPARWRAAIDAATELERTIAAGGAKDRCDAALAALRAQCTACHRIERDGGLRPR